MKTYRSLLVAALCAVALGTPALTLADSISDATPGTTTASPSAAPHHRHHGFAAMAQALDLTQQQQGQIKTLIDNYKQAHPKGSQPDDAARKQLHEQILAVLTPAQRAKLEQLKQQWHTKRVQQSPAPTPSPQ